MYEEMCRCSSLFTKFGGHPMAAGLSLPEENIDAFREQMNRNCPLTVEQLQPKVHIDVPMPVDYVTNALVEEFHILAPFGKDNPKPVFADRNLRISRMWVVGKNQNLYWQDKREKQADSGHPYSMEQLTFEENPYINITEYTQIAMLTMEVAILKVLEAKGLKAEMAAGLSLGEYGALAAAGVMELPDLFRIIRMRGIYMQEAYPEGGAMAAILGLDGDTVAKICGQTAKETGKVVSVANYNCPGQIVITGEADAVAAASEALKEAGAKRCIPLKVSGPFHSALLKTAGEQLAEELKSVKLSTPWIPYVSNVTADYVTDASQVAGLLKQQVSSPVHFTQSVERMIADGVDTFIEIGPGKTLSSFVRKIDRNVKVYNIEKPEDLDRVMEELAC